MKHNKAFLVILFTMSFLVQSAVAQRFESPVRELFDKYESQNGMNMIFFSKKMFELKFRQVVQEHSEISDDILDNFNEMIMIGGEDENLISPNEISNLKKILNSKGYEQIVKMVEDDESLTVLMLEDKSNGRIKDLIVMAIEDDEQIIMSISGSMTLEDIILVSRLLDINILDVLDV